jgi:hypothetical protein
MAAVYIDCRQQYSSVLRKGIKMKKFWPLILLLTSVLVVPFNEAQSGTVLLDGDTPQTGSNLETEPLNTPYGSITYHGGTVQGEFYHDFAYMTSPYAELIFNFDVDSISLTAYSLAGGIYTAALDINGSVIDSHHTLDNILFYPISLSGTGIRSLRFVDGRLDGGWASIDDVVLTTSAPIVPEPISSTLFVVGGATLGFRHFRKKFNK